MLISNVASVEDPPTESETTTNQIIRIIQKLVLTWDYAVARLSLEKTVTIYLADLQPEDDDWQRLIGKSKRETSFEMAKRSTLLGDRPASEKHQSYSLSYSHLYSHPSAPSPPTRSSSCQFAAAAQGDAPHALRPASSQIVYEQERPGSSNGFKRNTVYGGGGLGSGSTGNLGNSDARLMTNPRQNVPTSALAGIKNLAAERADLYLLQKRLLENFARSRGWRLSWAGRSQAVKKYSTRSRKRRKTFEERADRREENQDEMSGGSGSESDEEKRGEEDVDSDDTGDGTSFDGSFLVAVPSLRIGMRFYEVFNFQLNLLTLEKRF